MSRILKTGVNQVTQGYAEHCKEVAAGKAWAKGIDVVKQPSQTDSIIAHSAGSVVKVMTGQRNGTKDNEGMGYGNYVMIRHADNYVTLYAHMASVSVKVGQIVQQGDTIGAMGNTGNSFGAHLHFELRKYKTAPSGNLHDVSKYEWLDPTPYLDADLPGAASDNGGDYNSNTVPNRFKVMLSGTQKGAYTKYVGAVSHANRIGGYVVDGTNGKTIYTAVTATEDYTKSTVPNRFKIRKNGVQIGAYTSYTKAVSYASANNAHVYDGNNGKMIY